MAYPRTTPGHRRRPHQQLDRSCLHRNETTPPRCPVCGVPVLPSPSEPYHPWTSPSFVPPMSTKKTAGGRHPHASRLTPLESTARLNGRRTATGVNVQTPRRGTSPDGRNSARRQGKTCVVFMAMNNSVYQGNPVPLCWLSQIRQRQSREAIHRIRPGLSPLSVHPHRTSSRPA